MSATNGICRNRKEDIMSGWKALADFMYGDVRTDTGFWYSRPVWKIDGLTEEQLFWVPDPKSLCILWHVGHIAHR